MMYSVLRWMTGIALHWFYSRIETIGKEKIPATGPVLLAASHHNALIDALIAVWISPRHVTLTAKATLMDNVFLGWLLSLVGVVPLRRAADEKKRVAEGSLDPSRNAGAFESLLEVLEKGGMILIFPEGKSHSEASLAPLRTGVARIALEARDVRRIRGIQIVPLGINFEDKGNPGTAVLAEVGEPLPIDGSASSVDQVTAEVARRLAAVSLKKPRPSDDREAVKRKGAAHSITSPLAAWGELTHRYIINFARDLAVNRSRNPDDPAMLTIIYSLVLVLISYVIQFAIVALIFSPLVAAVFIATLPLSAYWAAYKSHPRPES